MISVARGLIVAMYTPWRIKCGISDYSRYLVQALQTLPEIDYISLVEPPEAVIHSRLEAVMNRLELARAYRLRGSQTHLCHLTHIQHQYFLFGGVAGFKNFAVQFYKSSKPPIILTVHEIAHPPEGASPLIRKAIERANYTNFFWPSIAQLIVHTTADKQQLMQIGMEAEKITVIPHGVPTPLPLPDVQSARAELGLQGKRVLTLFGFLSRKKGHSTALRALQMLPEDVVLIFAGGKHPEDSTNYVPRLIDFIQQNGLQERVRITGYIPPEQIPPIMAATDLAIAPYPESSGSGSLANLIAYRRAVLASNIAPHQEIEAGMPGCMAMFPAGNSEALAEKILQLLHNEDQLALLQNQAARYAEKHTYLNMALQTLQVYQHALQ